MPHHHKQDPTAPPVAPAPDPAAPPTVETPPPPGRSAMDTSKTGILGRPVRIYADSNMCTAVLIDYVPSQDSYVGAVYMNGFIKLTPQPGSSIIGFDPSQPFLFQPQRRIAGLRPYPYDARPDEDFQFVWPGQDEQPLIDIGTANAFKNATPPGQPVDTTGEGQN